MQIGATFQAQPAFPPASRTEGAGPQGADKTPGDPAGKTDPGRKGTPSDSPDAKATDPKVKTAVSALQRRDREVRTHEAAHAAAGGAYVRGGPSFTYTTGPDGKRYATGGEVEIDTSGVAGDPRATATKMQVVRRAALAPANPSGQDRAVAARAGQAEAQAQLEAALESTYGAKGQAVPQAPGRQVDRRA